LIKVGKDGKENTTFSSRSKWEDNIKQIGSGVDSVSSDFLIRLQKGRKISCLAEKL
jgi:hypothetical protein